MTARRHRRAAVLSVLALIVASAPSGCASVQPTVPGCGSVPGLALMAQAVPGAAYVPCVAQLATGWRATGFDASTGSARFSLTSDRSPGHPVRVELRPACDVSGATAAPARAAGVRTYTRLRSIAPRYAGTTFDVFAGGCVSYAFDFPRGPHISLVEDFGSAVDLYPRQELAIQVHDRLGVRI